MNDRIDHSGKQYAVIEGGHEGRREPFVLAYREEKSLRDLIAAPSIIALGFASREQAVANIAASPGALSFSFPEATHRRYAARVWPPDLPPASSSDELF